MIKVAEYEAAWFVELHPKGWSQLRQVRDVLREHVELLLEGKGQEWVVVAVRPDFAEAQAELTRIRKLLREEGKKSGADDAGQKDEAQEDGGLLDAGAEVGKVAGAEVSEPVGAKELPGGGEHDDDSEEDSEVGEDGVHGRSLS